MRKVRDATAPRPGQPENIPNLIAEGVRMTAKEADDKTISDNKNESDLQGIDG